MQNRSHRLNVLQFEILGTTFVDEKRLGTKSDTGDNIILNYGLKLSVPVLEPPVSILQN